MERGYENLRGLVAPSHCTINKVLRVRGEGANTENEGREAESSQPCGIETQTVAILNLGQGVRGSAHARTAMAHRATGRKTQTSSLFPRDGGYVVRRHSGTAPSDLRASRRL